MPTATDPATIYCPKCRYNLTGLTRDVCPECGEAFDAEALREQVLNPSPKGANFLLLLFAPALAGVSPILISLAPDGTAMLAMFVLFFTTLYLALSSTFRVTMRLRTSRRLWSQSTRYGMDLAVLCIEIVGVVMAFTCGVWIAIGIGIFRL